MCAFAWVKYLCTQLSALMSLTVVFGEYFIGHMRMMHGA